MINRYFLPLLKSGRRRSLLRGLAIFPALYCLPKRLVSASDPTTEAALLHAFHDTAQILTGKTFSLSLAKRAYVALARVDNGFPHRAQALSRFLYANGVTNADAFKVHRALSESLRQDALAIVSSLYLGYAGVAKWGVAKDGTQFVTYTEALMHRFSTRYTPIPSYSRWNTGYWTRMPD